MIFSERKRNIHSDSSVKKVHSVGETAIVERERIFVSTVIKRAVLEMEPQLFRRFKRLLCTSVTKSTATDSQALHLLDEQYKVFEKHLLNLFLNLA